MIGYIGDMAAKGYKLVIGPHLTTRGFYAKFIPNYQGSGGPWEEAGHGINVEDAVEMAYKVANNLPVTVPPLEAFK